MKKILFLVATVLACISCQEEISTQAESFVPQSKNLQVVQITDQGEIIPVNGTVTRSSIEGELALQFASESAYQSTITEISRMTAKERLAYTDNFTSLQKLAAEADKELDEIGEAATNEADFRKKYAQYVEKYSGKLITNKYDAEDLTLYVPDGDNLSTYFINENKKVVIGNEIKKVSLNNDMSDSEKAVFATTALANETTNRFDFKETVDGKKTTGNIEIDSRAYINVHVGCQKKLWYGWRRDDHRDIYYQVAASPMAYRYIGPYGQELYTNNIQYYAYHNDGDKHVTVGSLQPGGQYLSGTLRVWTDNSVSNVKDSVEYNNVYALYENKLGKFKLPKLNNSESYGGDFYIVKTK